MTEGAETVAHVAARDVAGGQFRYYDFVMAAFVAILLLSNVIGAAKLASVELFGRSFVFGAGILFFPISYVIGDVLTEVYGYGRARRCIWAGFAALAFLAVMTTIVVALPPSPDWKGQPAYDEVFGTFGTQTIRIVGASMLAFWLGEFVNSFVLARMKLLTRGRMLWTRTIGSTIVGEGIDSLIFYPAAFYGVWASSTLLKVMAMQWALKVAWEVLLTPVTYAVVGFLKKREGVDVYDEGTDFTPFATRV